MHLDVLVGVAGGAGGLDRAARGDLDGVLVDPVSAGAAGGVVERADLGYLKVSFFGPFYGSYVVFDLDQKEYRYALVSGPDKSYLWLLARSPTLEPATRDGLIARAAALGFDTSKLILVDHAPLP